MSSMEKLTQIRSKAGTVYTDGLPDTVIANFLKADPKLVQAIDEAVIAFAKYQKTYPEICQLPELEQIKALQQDYVNFYSEETVNRYVAIAARGPWIITSCGRVIYDAGGYGMLGLGHAPEQILAAMNQPQVMANVMTPSVSQRIFTDKLKQEIGHTRSGSKRHPFSKFLCLNSGSESVTVAARISDINAANLTAAGARHAGKSIKFMAFSGGFHGRTDRPAQFSDSSLPKYRAHLASFRNRDNLITIDPNNKEQLVAAFKKAEADNVFIEAFFIEPVMGEGNPGMALDADFYALARKLTTANGTLLVCDSIQAGLRAHGCVSMTDYPGFAELDPPDMETFSKALNAGQYPLSVLALTSYAASIHIRGIYGNTMTTNPRALDAASAVLSGLTPEFRRNVQERGLEFKQKLKALQQEFPDVIESVQGTGLLVAAAINPNKFKVVADDGLENRMRKAGVGVIHGGKNALRFTPQFLMTSAEVDLIINVLRSLIKAG